MNEKPIDATTTVDDDDTTSTDKNTKNDHQSLLFKCPLCDEAPVINETCPGSCGSLEGMMVYDPQQQQQQRKKSSRTFGFDWANGYVAPFLGIHRSAVKEALEAADIAGNDTMVDLGCGDGRICHLAWAMGAARAVGYDLDESLIAIAKSEREGILDTETNVSHLDMRNTSKEEREVSRTASFHIANLFEVDLEPFSIITMFLLPETTDKLVPTLSQALRSKKLNVRIIAFGWPIPGLGNAAAKYTNKTGSLLDKWYLYTNTTLPGTNPPKFVQRVNIKEEEAVM
ncbi:unnamed protein product [Cylindrotheca closterium]|uniref:Methyltransferase domain-containing protein n=1 Tax=Cylindrotheca closterium TaxID=2856 RepID=A0AAD2FGF3_9STRA|nr:unnamed protein product [Cylindrotheca closterium]CAJ1932890.1 unnamed protein product [Cylindrotheca closterium]